MKKIIIGIIGVIIISLLLIESFVRSQGHGEIDISFKIIGDPNSINKITYEIYPTLEQAEKMLKCYEGNICRFSKNLKQIQIFNGNRFSVPAYTSESWSPFGFFNEFRYSKGIIFIIALNNSNSIYKVSNMKKGIINIIRLTDS